VNNFFLEDHPICSPTEFPCPDSRLSLVSMRQGVPKRPASAPAVPNRPRDSHPPCLAASRRESLLAQVGVPTRLVSRRGLLSRRTTFPSDRSHDLVPAVLSVDRAAVITLQDLTDRDLRAHESVSSGSRPCSGEARNHLSIHIAPTAIPPPISTNSATHSRHCSNILLQAVHSTQNNNSNDDL
jgi:hypothetical protein